MSEHIVYLQSASSGARSMQCPGWCALTYYYRDKLPPEDKTYSAPGDHSHACLEADINKVNRPKKSVKFLKQDDADKRHFAAVAFAYKVIKKAIKKHGGKYASEAAVKIFPEYNYTGHIDFTHIYPKVLHVTDYKHGEGKPVKAEDNTQGVSYLHGALERALKAGIFPDHKQATYKFTIIQPRCMAVDPVQTWTLDYKTLKAKVKLLKAAVSNADACLKNTIASDEKPNRKHLFKGDECQFCPVKVRCPEWHEPVQRVVTQYKDDTNLHPDAYPDVTDEALEQLVLDAIGLEGYMKKGKELVAHNLATGKGAGLLKTVQGDSRTYMSPKAKDVLTKELKAGNITQAQYDDCFKDAFTTLPVLKNVLPAKLIKRITKQSRNKDSIVSVNDKRLSKSELAAEKFK